MLRCGSVRFSDVVNPTVRFVYILFPTVRLGAVFRNRKTYGAVRCGFQEGKKENRTVKNSVIFTINNKAIRTHCRVTKMKYK